MDELGRNDQSDVLEWFNACREHCGLADIQVYGGAWGSSVRAMGRDPINGQKIHLMLNGGAEASVKFDFVEATEDEFDPAHWNDPPRPNRFGELLSVARSGDPEYWRNARNLLEGFLRVASDVIDQELEDAAISIGMRLQRQLDNAVQDDTGRLRREAFKAACERRAPFADYIRLAFFDQLPKRRPSVYFGHGRGLPDAVFYNISPFGNMNLNGLEAMEEDLEEVLLQTYSDPWARLGARNAAQDLLAMQSAAADLRESERERIRQDDPSADVSAVGLPTDAEEYLAALFSAKSRSAVP